METDEPAQNPMRIRAGRQTENNELDPGYLQYAQGSQRALELFFDPPDGALNHNFLHHWRATKSENTSRKTSKGFSEQ
jgi:hypothetical protein